MPKFGRRLYFNTQNGHILYDTGEMEGDIIRPSVSSEIEMLNFGEVDKKNVDCVEFEYGQDREKFNQQLFFKINLKNRKIKFYGVTDFQKKYYNMQEVKKEYTKEEIYHFYENEYINFNLAKLLTHQDPVYRFRWLTLDEINIRPEHLEKSWHYYYFDNYIADSANDKTKLGRDILENGTYWPVLVAKMPDQGDTMFVFEGNHRILSAKLLQMEGNWDNNRKLLCMEIINDKYIRYKENVGVSALSEFRMRAPITLRMPFVMKFGSTISPSDPQVMEEMDIMDIKLVNEDTIEFETDVYNEFISMSQAYPHWLRDIFYEYKQKNNEMIKPSPIINNEEAWNRWVTNIE